MPLLVLLGIFGSGCGDVGNAPAGNSQEEQKAAFDKLPIEERAKTLMGLPGPIDDKRQKVKDMYAKEGKEAPPEVLGLSPNGKDSNKPPVPTAAK